jgi:hypothetical protein
MTGFYKDYQDASDTHENSAESYATDASNFANAAAQSASAASSSATASAQALLDHENLQVTTATFNLANGLLRLIKANGGEVDVDLDGRYAELTGADFTGDVSIPSAGELQSEGALNLRFNSEGIDNQGNRFKLHYDDSTATAIEVNSLGNVFIGTTGLGQGGVPKSFNKLAVGSMGTVSASTATVGIKADSSYQALAMQANGNNNTVKFNVLDNGTLNIGTAVATNLQLTYDGNLNVSGTIEGRDVAYDGSKLDTIEPAADVTDATNVTAAGAAMLTGADFTGDVRLSDDVELRLGDGGDLRIFHSSNNNTSTIREEGTGSFAVQGNNLVLSDTNSSKYLFGIAGGATKIYYNGSPKLETSTDGISVTGDIAVSGTVDGVDIAALNTAVSDKANLSGAIFTGGVGVGSLSSPQTLGVYGTTFLYNGLNVVGNITATGTVDGRDVAADGTKLDGIGKFSFGDPSNIPVQTTAPVTLITSDIPAAGTEVGQYVTARFNYKVRNTTTATKKNFNYQIRSEMKSKNTTVVSLGTGTYVSSPSSYNAWYYVSGNKTHIISAGRGKVATSTGGLSSGGLIGSYYDGANDRTYIRVSKYPDYNTVYNNVEIFYSVYSFTSPNTWVVQNTVYNSKYVSLVGSATETKHITVNDFFGRHSTATTFRIQVDNLSSVSGWDLDVYDFNGTVENAL